MKKKNKIGAITGGGIGVASGIAGVISMSSGTAAATSSALATAGSVVGGGMAFGVGVMSAIPIITGAIDVGLGLGIVKLIGKNKKRY